jgi:type IV pilus assembly protein PilN
MAQINLLPWREERRQELKREFLVILGLVALLGVGLVVLADRVVNSQIDNQNARNQYLTENIKELDKKVAEIKDLQRRRNQLIDRMRVIQELQGNRPVIVRVFDELVRTLSKGVHYNKLNLAAGGLTVEGTAESNNRISSLMRNLDESEWFESPNLRSIKEDPNNSDYGAQASKFDLTFTQHNPLKDEEEGE